jgi:hypothetical protein
MRIISVPGLSCEQGNSSPRCLKARVSSDGTQSALRSTCACQCSTFSLRTFVEIRCGFEAVADLETANLRLSQLASVSPGEYFVFNLRTHQVSTHLVSTSEPERHFSIRSHHYDLVRKADNESAIWLEAAPDLKTAESRIHELAFLWPGAFQIMDQQTHQIVERIIGRSDLTEVDSS